MKYYPVFLDIKDKHCLVVGGGAVGARKAAILNRCGARVTVVSKAFCPAFTGLEKTGGICLENRSYVRRDLDGAFLVFAATDDAGLNRRILADAAAAGVLCNAADAPDEGNFILPALVNRGDLICAVSTCGASPALARKIRKDLEEVFGDEYTVFLALMAGVRKQLLASGHDPDGHRKIFRGLVEKDLPSLIADGNIPAVDEILHGLLGHGFSFRSLVPHDVLSQES